MEHFNFQLETERVEEAVVAHLPPPTFILPRCVSFQNMFSERLYYWSLKKPPLNRNILNSGKNRVQNLSR